MKRPISAALLSIFLLAVQAEPASACTTFCFEHAGRWVFGRNYDWSTEAGIVMVNKRNVAKTAAYEHNPARWTSEYGSVTFNQYGREFPTGGMNEAGLVVECMWLDGTEYSAADSRPQLGELGWIQYQLDTAGSVPEVLASDARVRISDQRTSPLHFLVCDRKGGCAAIEFLDGEMVVHAGPGLPATCLTNSTYDRSVEFLERSATDGGGRAEDYPGGSLSRFRRAAQGVADYPSAPSPSPIDYAFGLLADVSSGWTRWAIVYDVGEGRVHFRTRERRSIRTVDVDEFDFSCSAPVRILDMGGEEEGDVTRAFVEYSFDANHRLIRRAYAETDFLRDVPPETILRAARYPDRMTCTE